MYASYFVIDCFCFLTIIFVLYKTVKKKIASSFANYFRLFSIFCFGTIIVDFIYEILYIQAPTSKAFININIIFVLFCILTIFINHRMMLVLGDSKIHKQKLLNIIEYLVLLVPIVLVSINFFYPLLFELKGGILKIQVNAYFYIWMIFVIILCIMSVSYGIYYCIIQTDIKRSVRIFAMFVSSTPALLFLALIEINIPITSMITTFLCIMFYLYNISDIRMNQALITRQTEKISFDKSVIDSLKSMFYCIYHINLVDGRFIELSKTEVESVRGIIGEGGDAQEKLDAMCNHLAAPEVKDELWKFSRINTLAERLKERRTVSIQFKTRHSGWQEGTFIRVATDESENATGVLWVIRNANDIKKLEEESNTDRLTGLYNRRAFDDDVIKVEGRDKTDLAIITFDVNGLKKINDSLGHAAGDELIQGAAECISEVFGSQGRVYRTGGDEFLGIVFTKDMKALVEQFHSVVENWHGATLDSLSISMGYALWIDNQNSDIRELSSFADQYMYFNKRKYYEEKKEQMREE